MLESKSDYAISVAVYECLAINMSILPKSITVCVRRGWVTLFGLVQFSFQPNAAEYGIMDVPGVVGITNHIVVTKRHLGHKAIHVTDASGKPPLKSGKRNTNYVVDYKQL